MGDVFFFFSEVWECKLSVAFDLGDDNIPVYNLNPCGPFGGALFITSVML